MNLAYIMGGVPGSGKSTAAREIAQSGRIDGGVFWTENSVTYYGSPATDDTDAVIVAAIHSTDQYFMQDGEYKFNPRQLGIFHNANFKAFRKSCEAGIPIVICDNTNTTRKEWNKYAACADNRGYIVAHVTMPHPKPSVAAERNSHGVPLDAINRMIKRWEPNRS
jgi:hypothetical protein